MVDVGVVVVVGEMGLMVMMMWVTVIVVGGGGKYHDQMSYQICNCLKCYE